MTLKNVQLAAKILTETMHFHQFKLVQFSKLKDFESLIVSEIPL